MSETKAVTISHKELEFLHFKKSTINIYIQNNLINYSGIDTKGESTTPSVYLWLIINQAGTEYDVVYVGKAGKGLNKRHKEHLGGYRTSLKCQSKSKRIKAIEEALESGRSIEVWFRESDIMKSILNSHVWTYSVEEEAFILKYHPLLNSANPPQCTFQPE